ncbi:hypothetical protein MYSE111917_05430 [Mycobacterium senriense]
MKAAKTVRLQSETDSRIAKVRGAGSPKFPVRTGASGQTNSRATASNARNVSSMCGSCESG